MKSNKKGVVLVLTPRTLLCLLEHGCVKSPSERRRVLGLLARQQLEPCEQLRFEVLQASTPKHHSQDT